MLCMKFMVIEDSVMKYNALENERKYVCLLKV
jgi:hypothetical protein